MGVSIIPFLSTAGDELVIDEGGVTLHFCEDFVILLYNFWCNYDPLWSGLYTRNIYCSLKQYVCGGGEDDGVPNYIC